MKNRIITTIIAITMIMATLFTVTSVNTSALVVADETPAPTVDSNKKYYFDGVKNDKWFEYYYATNDDIIVTNLSDTFGDTIEIPGVIENKVVKNVILLDFDKLKKVCLDDSIEKFDCYNALVTTESGVGSYEQVNEITTLKVGSSFKFEESLAGEISDIVAGNISAENRAVYKIPENVFWKHAYPFLLEKYETDENNVNYATDQGVLYTKDYKTLIDCPMKNQLKEYKINDKTEMVRASAFFLVETLVKITLGKDVISIGESAFYGCPLAEVNMNSKLEIIDNNAFAGCANIRNLVLPASLKKMGIAAFAGTGVKNLVYKCKNLRPIYLERDDDYDYVKQPDSWFVNTPLTSVKFASKIDIIPANAFRLCVKLKKVTMPKSCKKISCRAFFGCGSLKKVVLPKKIKAVDKKAFADCSGLEKVKIFGKKTTIAKKAIGFNPYGESKTKIVAPQGSKAQKYAKKNKIKFEKL